MRIRQPLWKGLAVLLLAAGFALSTVAAVVWRAQTRTHDRESFEAEAGAVGSTVTTALLRMHDLTLAVRTLVASDPGLTNRGLEAWYDDIAAERRYPGALAFGYLDRVPAARLGAHEAALRADPVPGQRLADGTFTLVPGGSRPAYCLLRLATSSMMSGLVPNPGIDLCAIGGIDTFRLAGDTGSMSSSTIDLSTGRTVFAVIAPVYRGGGVPATLRERRARIAGWIGGMFDVGAILRDVARGRDLKVSVSRQDTAYSAAVSSRMRRELRRGGVNLDELESVASVGRVSGDAVMRRSFTQEADGRWTVTVERSGATGFWSPEGQGLVVLVGGIVVSLLLFLLVGVLAGGRRRALSLVAEKTDQLRQQALHDALTGLPNRALILERLEQMLLRTRRDGTLPAAMFIDLDGFKLINDTYGHACGDELLRAVGARISGSLRDTDSAGRVGGDEFVVLVSGDAPELVAERLLDALRQPFALDGATTAQLSVGASIGLAIGDRPDAAELLRDADIALYEAKSTGRDRYVVFDGPMHAAAQDQLALRQDLRASLDSRQLHLVFQPTFDLAEGAVTGAEALLRWEHPTRGSIPPMEFIPVAEESGLILDIGRWVLGAACDQGAAWQAQGHRIDVAVNLSARQLEDPGLLEAVAFALESSGFDPARLVLEITETALMRDAATAAGRLAELKALGVRIAIDDFGTGYSSLAYLQQYKVDTLKIDRAFIAGIGHSDESAGVVRSILDLARTLQLETIAEGIEEPEQLSHLRAEGCSTGQGFLLGRPVEASVVGQLLDAARAAL